MLWFDVTSHAGVHGAKSVTSRSTTRRVLPCDGTGLAVAIGWVGEWRSLVARTVRDREVAGSSPASPTTVGVEPSSPPRA